MRSGVWFPSLGLVALLCGLSLGPVEGGRVLVVPVDGSHWLSMKILVKELIQRGHEILVLVPETSLLINGSDSFQTEIYPVPYTKAEMDANFQDLRDEAFVRPKEFMDMLRDVQLLISFTSMQVRGCEHLLNNQPLMKRLREQSFDVLLTDPFLPCGSILAHIFSLPAVYFLRSVPCELDSKANQCPTPPSYVPVYFTGNTDVMTFPQRVKNMVMSMVESYMCTVMFSHFDDLVRRTVEESLTYRELIGRGAFWLLRYDFIFEWPKPIMPNTAFIGGINCQKKAPLPADLQEFVEGSGDDGFIVFTLGSMVSNMPKEKAKQFFDAFRQIPQRVVWRFTGVPPADAPKNVKLMKWLPQNDLLAHPKAKAFITHGGTHGIYEGICNAVPMLMFPLFGDQGDNVHRLVSRGAAEKLSVFDVTSEKLVTALNKIIHEKSYKEKISEMSRLHLDRPVDPLNLAAFWTEFVMRHQGAAHLRVAAHELNWFQYHSLDVIGLLIIILLTILWVMLKCCLFCIRKCLRKETAKKKKKE